MGKDKPAPYLIQLMAEGNTAERRAEKAEFNANVMELVKELPDDPTRKIVYLRDLVIKVLREELPADIFMSFVHKTNTSEMVFNILPRAKLIAKRLSSK